MRTKIVLAAVLVLGTFASHAYAELDSKTNNTGTGNIEGSSGSLSVTFLAGDFAGSGIVTDVTVDVTVTPGDSDFVSTGDWNELSATLESPTGTVLQLLNQNDFAEGAPVAQTSFSFSDAGIALPGTPPTAGASYVPTGVGGLASFDGESAIGTWTLTFSAAGFDIDQNPSFDGFTLNLTTADAVAAPEPGTFALFALGGLGLLGLSRRRRKLAALGQV